MNLPEKELTYLTNLNKHIRDDAIKREVREKSRQNETDHIETYEVWTVNSDPFYKGVTSVVASLFQEFDADAVIDKMMKSPKWEQSPYYGMTKEEIKTLWSDKGKKAADDGTAMHYSIECYYNNESLEDDVDAKYLLETDEYKQFLQFAEDYKHLKPYRTEWLVYHEETKIKGIIDMIYENEDGTLSIYDWKRTKELTKYNKWQSGKEPISHIPDSNYWHYCVQLNIYKRILEEKYDKVVKEMYLVAMYPGQDKYIRMKVVEMPSEINDIFNSRMAYVNKRRVKDVNCVVESDEIDNNNK